MRRLTCGAWASHRSIVLGAIWDSATESAGRLRRLGERYEEQHPGVTVKANDVDTHVVCKQFMLRRSLCRLLAIWTKQSRLL